MGYRKRPKDNSGGQVDGQLDKQWVWIYLNNKIICFQKHLMSELSRVTAVIFRLGQQKLLDRSSNWLCSEHGSNFS